MKHRLLMLAYAALCAFILHQLTTGLVLFAHSLSAAHAMTCDVVVESCETGLAVSVWGVE